jgi:hypothetical protein
MHEHTVAIKIPTARQELATATTTAPGLSLYREFPPSHSAAVKMSQREAITSRNHPLGSESATAIKWHLALSTREYPPTSQASGGTPNDGLEQRQSPHHLTMRVPALAYDDWCGVPFTSTRRGSCHGPQAGRLRAVRAIMTSEFFHQMSVVAMMAPSPG